MAATNNSQQTHPFDRRWLGLDSTTMYVAIRCLVVLLLFMLGTLITRLPMFSAEGLGHPFTVLTWAYAAFTLVTLVALILPPLAALHRYAFLVDILFISLFNYFSYSGSDLFYPLYFLPLIGASVETSGQRGLLYGMFAALGYAVAFIAIRLEIDTGLRSDSLNIVAAILRGLALMLIPALAGSLAERSGQINRERVAEAQQETLLANSQVSTYREQNKALYEVAYTLSSTMNYQSVLNVMLQECRKLVPYNHAMALLSTGEPDELYVAASLGLNEYDQTERPLISEGPLWESLRAGDPLLFDPTQVEALKRFGSLRGCRSACAVPLRAGLKTYGLFIIASHQEHAFNEEQLDMVAALTNYAIIALHNAQLVHDLREERNKLISKDQDVRHQLARDLHDGPAQALAAITMNIEFVKRLLERDPSRINQELDKLAILSKRTTHEIRTMLFELRPLVLETQGLDTTLRQYLERFQGNKTEIILESEAITATLDTKTEGTLFNIIQESINNALKHAQAKHIWVRLKQDQHMLETTIQDDGRGFDLNKVKASYEQRGSFGLLNIDERAKLIGGTAEMLSEPGKGTLVRVIVPLT